MGASNERTNLEYIERICTRLDELKPSPQGSYAELIRHVSDRPGHDVRYGLNAGKLRRALGWKPLVEFSTGLDATLHWYLAHFSLQGKEP